VESSVLVEAWAARLILPTIAARKRDRETAERSFNSDRDRSSELRR